MEKVAAEKAAAEKAAAENRRRRRRRSINNLTQYAIMIRLRYKCVRYQSLRIGGLLTPQFQAGPLLQMRLCPNWAQASPARVRRV